MITEVDMVICDADLKTREGARPKRPGITDSVRLGVEAEEAAEGMEYTV